MEEDLKLYLDTIVQRLNQIESFLHQTAGHEFVEEHVPDGDVAVHPTGVHGKGKVRYWPKFKPEHLNAFGYVNLMMRTINPETGKPFYTPGRFGPVLQGAFEPYLDNIPAAADRSMYPDDWYTQEELDRMAALAERDKGAAWVSGE